MPGVLPGDAAACAWGGVLMPSVDRVGRYFPLTLVRPLGAGPASTQQMGALWHWLGRLDELARDALYEDWSAERLEEELARMAAPELAPQPIDDSAPPSADGVLHELSCGAGLDAALHIGVEAQRGWAERAHGCAWWFARPDDAPPRLLRSRRLPAASSLARLFGPAATI